MVGDMASIEVESDILSDEIHRVHVGQIVRLEGDCLGGKPASGKVTKIYPAGFTTRAAPGPRHRRRTRITVSDDRGPATGPGWSRLVQGAAGAVTQCRQSPGRSSATHELVDWLEVMIPPP